MATDYDYSKLQDVNFRTNYYFKANDKIKIELTINDLISYKNLAGIHHKIEFKKCQNYAIDMRRYLKSSTNSNILMLWKPRDVSWKLDEGFISKSRPLDGENNILLPLNYIRHYPANEIRLACNDGIPFRNKIKSAVWRGAITGFENLGIRSKFNLNTNIWNGDVLKYDDIKQFSTNNSIPSRFNLVNRYYNSPLVNVGFVGMPTYMVNFITNRRYKIKNKIVPSNLLKYKYQISLEGNDVATNLKWLFASRSVVLMPKPTCETWFCEGLLEPWVHYVPLENHLGDLIEKLIWCENNTKLCEKIIENQRTFFAIMYDQKLNNKIINSIFEKYNNTVEFVIKKYSVENELQQKQYDNIVSSFLKYDNVKMEE